MKLSTLSPNYYHQSQGSSFNLYLKNNKSFGDKPIKKNVLIKRSPHTEPIDDLNFQLIMLTRNQNVFMHTKSLVLVGSDVMEANKKVCLSQIDSINVFDGSYAHVLDFENFTEKNLFRFH